MIIAFVFYAAVHTQARNEDMTNSTCLMFLAPHLFSE